MTAAIAAPATERQISFASSLIRSNHAKSVQLSGDTDNAAETALAVEEFIADIAFLSKKQASEMITSLLDNERELKKKLAERPAAAPAEQVTDGMYMVGDRIFKVQIAKNGSGRLYAKELLTEAVGDGTYDSRFQYAPGALKLLSAADRMTLDQAKAFGALYGNCCACGRDLTDETSIALGIGPICRAKF